MTPEQIEIHRQRFEEIARSKVDIASDGSGHYFLSHVHYMWQGYLLCAENMPEIELPKKTTKGNFRSSYEQGCDDGAELMLEDCTAMIESQGYTVKTL